MWGGPEVRVRQRMRRLADDVVGAESMGKSGVPAAPGRGRRRGTGGSESADAGGLRTLRALRHLELHPLVLLQRAVAVCLDGRVVREHVRAAVLRGDESKALVGVEPLHSSGGHGFLLPNESRPTVDLGSHGVRRLHLVKKNAPEPRSGSWGVRRLFTATFSRGYLATRGS